MEPSLTKEVDCGSTFFIHDEANVIIWFGAVKVQDIGVLKVWNRKGPIRLDIELLIEKGYRILVKYHVCSLIAWRRVVEFASFLDMLHDEGHEIAVRFSQCFQFH